MSRREHSVRRAAVRRSRRPEGQTAALRASVRRLERRVEQLAEELRDRGSSGLTDEQYADFEDTFRGSVEEISRRLEPYLPFVARAAAALGTDRVLDLGCGRGEWLSLLQRDGYTATGVDERKNAVARCLNLGLQAVVSDVFAFVKTQPSDAWTVVTGFHLVEHVVTGRLPAFFQEVFRILQPGGLLLLETPNLSNVLVGSCYFYLDPTHQRPLPPEAWSYQLTAAGFVDIGIMPMNPVPDYLAVHENGSQLETRVNDLFYGPRDLGLIAAKPSRQASSR
jgi:O-antigen chain-terminating methyltransferase